MKKLLMTAIASAMAWIITPQIASAQSTIFHLHAARVDRSGTSTEAVILIPVLGSSPFVFDAITSDLERDHVVYRVRFGGFEGRATIQSPYLAAYTKAVADLITRAAK